MNKSRMLWFVFSVPLTIGNLVVSITSASAEAESKSTLGTGGMGC
jgi:hypothetical protein